MSAQLQGKPPILHSAGEVEGFLQSVGIQPEFWGCLFKYLLRLSVVVLFYRRSYVTGSASEFPLTFKASGTPLFV